MIITFGCDIGCPPLVLRKGTPSFYPQRALVSDALKAVLYSVLDVLAEVAVP